MKTVVLLKFTLPALALGLISTPALAKCKTGKPAQNVQVAKNFYQAYQTGDAALMSRTVSADFVSEPHAPGAKSGPEGAINALNSIRATFSDVKMVHDEIITTGDKVIVRSTINALHTGPFFGVAATGRPVRFTAIDINTICGGRMVKSNHSEEWLAVLFQIGALPINK